MTFSTAWRTALSCEPNIISTLSESISLTVLLETSAGGAPASTNTISTWRPRMPPLALMVATPSSAAARCAGPNSAAGPESANSTPTFIVSAAAAGWTIDGAPITSAPTLAARNSPRRLTLIEVSIFPSRVGNELVIALLSSWCTRHRKHRLHRKRETEQVAVTAGGTVERQADRQAARGHTHRDADAGNAGIATGISVADHSREGWQLAA